MDRREYGRAMNSYHGGWVECGIRRTPVPVVVLDIRSTYPTLCGLLGVQELLTSESVGMREGTHEARALLGRPGYADRLDPVLFRSLRGLVRVRPDRDILPVKAHFSDGQQWDMAVAEVSGEELWVTLFDAAASALATGRPPEIAEALFFDPGDVQMGLRPVRLRGAVEIDPGRDDLFLVAAQEREQAKRRGGDGDEGLAQFLKTFGSSAGYGKYVEFRPRRLLKREREGVTVYGRAGAPFRRRVAAPEDPGPWCFPLIATMVTGGARFLLAQIEREVRSAGGVVAYRDTDSAFVVATRTGGLIACPNGRERLPSGTAAVRALSWDQVDGIVDRFAALSPFDPSAIPGSIVKVERENFDPATGERREVYFYGFASKRYVLYTKNGIGGIDVVKASDHGLGHLRNPRVRDPDGRENESGRLQFTKALWRYVLGLELGTDAPEPEWLDLPAAGTHHLGTSEAMRAVSAYNKKRPYAEQLKPHGFCLVLYVKPAGHPVGVDASRFHLIAPFDPNPSHWSALRCFDLYGEKTYRIRTGSIIGAAGDVCVVKSYRDYVDEYRRHPEAKLTGPDGQPCTPQTRGLLSRSRVEVTGVTHIGRETNELEAREAGLIHRIEDVQAEYGDEETSIEVLVAAVLADVPARVVASAIGKHAGTVEAFVREGRRPRRQTLQALTDHALRRARLGLRAAGVRPPRDEFDCLSLYLRAVRRPLPPRRCSGCGAEISRRARWCSDRCRKRTGRRST